MVYALAGVVITGAPLIEAFGAPATDSFVLDLSAAQTVATPVTDVIPNFQYQQVTVDGLLSVGPVDIVGALSLHTDEKYAEQQAGYWGGIYGTLDSGGVTVDLAPFSIRAGRFAHADIVHTPYSLFVSSRPLPVPLLDLTFESDRFFYTSRWLGLNRKSRLADVEERGANIRTYGVRFDALRVGVHDVLVYADRQFDYEYLLSPVPGFFLQYFKVAPGSPWSEFGNDNTILGVFADYTDPSYYAYAQVLVDDFNLPTESETPNQIAWSAGGTVHTVVGEFGFYHAGATMYTFQAYGGGSVGAATDTKYGYTYYPAVEYVVAGETRVIVPEDNYIGYLHGENNIAFLLDYSQSYDPVDIYTTLEYTLSGSKSPANPWHEFNNFVEGGGGTHFLDDDRLESKLTATGRADVSFGWWRAFAELSMGFVVNELELTDVPVEYAGTNNLIRYFVPGDSPARLFGGFTLGGSVRLPL